MFSQHSFISCFVLGVIGISIGLNASGLPADTYISVSEFHKYCPSSDCGKAMPCEGQSVRIKGKLDYSNIFDHTRYPQLPNEKFFLTDDNITVEILVATSDNKTVFRKIFDAREKGNNIVFVKGTVVGIDMPIMKSCHRGIRLELHSADDITFGSRS
jgi:hypothetical protein